MSLIKVAPYVLGVTPGVPGAPEPRMYPRSGYFLVRNKTPTLIHFNIESRTFPNALFSNAPFSNAPFPNAPFPNEV